MSEAGKAKREAGLKPIVSNRRALYDYFVEDRIEAGIQLLGTEVKSLRAGNVNLSDAYATPHKNEIYLLNINIAPYAPSGQLMNHAPLRRRKLLLHRRQIDDLIVKVEQKGHTLVPLSLYFKDGRAKVELGVCRGKERGDKREAIAEREQRREMDRAIRGGKRGRD